MLERMERRVDRTIGTTTLARCATPLLDAVAALAPCPVCGATGASARLLRRVHGARLAGAARR
jgi:hypothetical protein